MADDESKIRPLRSRPGGVTARNFNYLVKNAGAHRVFQFWADLTFTDKYKGTKISDRLEASRLLAAYGYGKPVERSLVMRAELSEAQTTNLLPELDAASLVQIGRALHAAGAFTPALTPGTPSTQGEVIDIVPEYSESCGDSELPGQPVNPRPASSPGSQEIDAAPTDTAQSRLEITNETRGLQNYPGPSEIGVGRGGSSKK